MQSTNTPTQNTQISFKNKYKLQQQQQQSFLIQAQINLSPPLPELEV